MTYNLWQILLLTVLIGIIIGSLIIIIFKLLQGKEPANSFVNLPDLIGLSATVEIPFNCDRQGKVKINYHGNIIFYPAVTDSKKELAIDDQVIIIAIKNNRLFVVSEFN